MAEKAKNVYILPEDGKEMDILSIRKNKSS
jgi:hypothetical protein